MRARLFCSRLFLPVILAGAPILLPGAVDERATASSQLAAVKSSPSDFLVEVWDMDRGLPHSSVTALAQTPDGYLWVGTLHGGLARFDGVRFVTFHPGNTPQLKSIEIHALASDTTGALWIGTAEGALVSWRGGRFRFEWQSPETPANWFRAVVASSTNELLLSSFGGSLFRDRRQGDSNAWETVRLPSAGADFSPCADPAGTVWYRTQDRWLARWQGAESRRLADASGLRGRLVGALAADRRGGVWVGTERELASWDGRQFVNRLPTNGPPTLAVQQLAFCDDGSLWVRTPGRLLKWQRGVWVAEAGDWPISSRDPIGPEELRADADGGVWLVNFRGGLWHVDSQGRTLRIGPEQGLPAGALTCWLEDREGNFWVGLTDGGLARIRKATFHVVWPAGAGPKPIVRSLCEDPRGALWLGLAGNQLLRWQAGQFTSITPPTTNVVTRDLTVCPDGRGRLWVGSVQNGVQILADETFSRPFPSEAIGTVARALFADHAGGLWIGSEFGLFAWRDGRLDRFTSASGFTPAFVLAITEDRTGTLWCGTAVGELREYRDGRFIPHRPADSLSGPPPPGVEVDPLADRGRGTLSGGERFWALRADADGAVWIGSLGGGLLRFKDDRFTRFTPHDGLPSEHVSQILEDDRGQLWLGTRNGIARVAKEQLNQFAAGVLPAISCITYGRSDGLPTVECSDGSQPDCWRGRDGRLWFATVKGAVWVQPSDVPFNPLPPPVVIEEIWVDGERLVNARPPEGRAGAVNGRFIQTSERSSDQTRIPAGRHYLEFRFTALSFTSPDKVRFAWQLEGLEKGWVRGGAQRSVSYSYLPPGDYRFRVRACNNDGVWNTEGAEFRFTILPYFWQTGWVRLLVVVVLAAVLLGLYRLKVSRLRALQRLRLRIARDLHDEIGANLGSISLLAQVMTQKPAAEDARLIHDIAAQTVDTLRDIVWFIDPAHERLSDLVARLQETARALLTGLAFEFEQSGDFSSEHLPLDFRRNALPLFKEALHNIVKHAHARHVRIAVRRRANWFEIHIQDDGVGFDPSARFSGNGLKNLRRRAQEMRGELTIESRPGVGTTLTLTARTT